MKEIHYCKVDAYGQSTGEVVSKTINSNEIKKDVYGFDTYKGHFIFYSKYQAQRAAQS